MADSEPETSLLPVMRGDFPFEINGPPSEHAKAPVFAEENCSLCVNPGVKIAAYA
jgi:hypothetical protein